jgi:hypothetical protein
MNYNREFRNLLKTTIGSLAEGLIPSIAKDLDGGVTNGKNIFLKRMAFYARMKKAIKSEDPDYIDQISQQWWTGDIAGHFYGKYSAHTNRFQELFLQHFSWSVEGPIALEKRFPYKSFVEFGCGDGAVLQHIAQKIDGIDDFIGLDINSLIIEKDRLTAKDHCSYICCKIQDFFKTQKIRPFNAFTFGGVLEYLSPRDLSQFYADLNRSGCGITLFEPLSSDPSASRKGGSSFIGSEVVYFDHDHSAYLSKSGFEIIEERIINLMSYRWLYVVAISNRIKMIDPAKYLM